MTTLKIITPDEEDLKYGVFVKSQANGNGKDGIGRGEFLKPYNPVRKKDEVLEFLEVVEE